MTTTTSAVVSAQAIDTVRVGSLSLEGARLELGSYTIENFRRVNGQDTATSTTTQTISRDTIPNQAVYVIETVHVSLPADTTVAVVVVRTSDFALIHNRVKATQDSAAVTANSGYLTGWVVLPNEPIRLIDQDLGRTVFPVPGQVPWLFPLLPLSPGYEAAIPHYSQWSAMETWKTIRVLGSERRLHGAERVDCWKVDGGELFPGYTVTYWVDKKTRRVVEGMARGLGTGPEYWSRIRI